MKFNTLKEAEKCLAKQIKLDLTKKQIKLEDKMQLTFVYVHLATCKMQLTFVCTTITKGQLAHG